MKKRLETLTNQKTRSRSLDCLRGAALVSMILYHACWDMVYLWGCDWEWYDGVGAYLWQQSICWTFILLSGYCWSMSRHPLRRGAVTLGAGALVWLVTEFIMPRAALRFGVLTFLGSAALCMIPAEKLLRQIPWRLGLLLHFALFLMFKNAARGWIGLGLGGRLGGISLAALPRAWYEKGLLSAWLGFAPKGFTSADYFPILPWWFLFCCGYFLWRKTKEGGKTEKERSFFLADALEWLGQHSLLVYLLHQPALYGGMVILDFLYALSGRIS